MLGLDAIKAHPYLAGGAAIATVAVVLLYSSGGSGVSGGYPDTSSVGAGTDLQAAQLAVGVRNSEISAGLQANTENNASQLALATLQVNGNIHLAEISSALEAQKITASSQLATLQSTLSARIQSEQITSSNKQQAATLAVLSQQIASNAAVSQAAIKAQANAAKCHSLFCKIFG